MHSGLPPHEETDPTQLQMEYRPIVPETTQAENPEYIRRFFDHYLTAAKWALQNDAARGLLTGGT